MSKKIETGKNGVIEMESPTAKFKKGIPNKGKGKVAVIAAPVSFTDAELEHYEYWLSLQSCIPWLYEKPKDKFSKDVLRDFMALYAKIKMAMQKVEPGKTSVCLGKSQQGGKDLVVTGGWYDTPQKEADFAISFFTAYLSSRMGSHALETVSAEAENKVNLYRGRIKKLEEDIERRDMRIVDLENALQKMEEFKKVEKSPLARSQGRLPSKRPVRVKAKAIQFKGKRRV